MEGEEETATNPSKHTTQNEDSQTKPLDDDASLQKKHQAMLQRLSNRHQARTSAKSAATADAETTASFLVKFSDAKRSIESRLSESSNLTPDPPRLKSHLADISSSISSLELLVAENSYLLPSYELRSSLKSVSDLRNSLENLNSELLPKQKFSFRSKSVAKTPTAATEITEKPRKPLPTVPIRDSPGLRNRRNETLTKNFKGTEIGEFSVTDLEGCDVRLIGCVSAMFVNRLRNSRVYVGPVIGSILIEEVENCVFVLASHQIRVHFAKGCDFYLRVRSRPIIEDCGGVRFGPYCLKYDGIEEDLREAGLEQETGNWSNVDDFKWLRAVQSPNWSVLEESERIGNVVIEDLGCGA